jgi:hypothetical protein
MRYSEFFMTESQFMVVKPIHLIFANPLRLNLLPMPLMIQRQQPIQQFAAGGFGHGEAEALFTHTPKRASIVPC